MLRALCGYPRRVLWIVHELHCGHSTIDYLACGGRISTNGLVIEAQTLAHDIPSGIPLGRTLPDLIDDLYGECRYNTL